MNFLDGAMHTPSHSVDPLLPSASPSEVGMDPSLLHDLTGKITSQWYPNVHSVLIAKNGQLCYEEYFTGSDQNFGKELGVYAHSENTLHDVRSISKSVVSLCIGIAIDKGFIKNVNQRISSFFPELSSMFSGKKSYWTIYHFLTMTTGLRWNEQVPYDDPSNDEIQMTHSDHPVRYVFSKPMDAIPGKQFNYSGGATQVLAAIVEKCSGLSFVEFAHTYLFHPMGIEHFYWNKFSVWNPGPGGDFLAAPSGLRLTSRDMMKLGLLLRNHGQWNHQAIVSLKWIRESFRQRIDFPSTITDGRTGYGYQFWMWKDRVVNKEIHLIAAVGNGDQRIYLDQANDMILVTTAGNYNHLKTQNNSYSLLKNHVYPTLADFQLRPHG